MIKTIKDIWYAITSPESYRDFMNYKKGKIFLYVLVLVVISGIISMGVPAARFMAAGGFEAILEEGIPDFTASSENGFWIEEPVEIDEYNFLIKANSDIVYEDITDLNGQYGSYEYVIMVDQEQIHVKTPGMQDITARFDEMNDFSFSKEDLLSYTSVMYMAIFWAFIMMILLDYFYYFITAAVISWGAGVIASFMRLRLGNKKLLKMAVYAGTLSYILSLVQVIIGKTIPNFTFFSLLISTGYMYFALKDYKESGIEELPPEQFGNREG
ncbi:MAG: DUF1189 domain-containing protein [Lachnospiraceae bacterium]|nr:DUF1189 domain-containing protein [Lachnospiraceae bacterium]